jgi:Glycosyl hydrolases family 35
MFRANSSVTGRGFPRKKCRLVAAAGFALLSISASAQQHPPQKPLMPVTGVQIVNAGNEPELRVGGVPYFIHAAQFDYFRIPPDLWLQSLNRYQELGINTIDLRIPWNWHEPSDGEFDFDGHTNPRRNLGGLLQLIAQTRMKLIVRPGPIIRDQWRNAGYPPWLLAYSDYQMSELDVEKGVAPPEAVLAARDADAAARRWLANDLHMTYARRWLTAVARELAPYSAKRTVTIPEPGDREGETQDSKIAGPLLFVALDDDIAVRPGAQAPELSRYLTELRGALIRGGLDALLFMSAPDIADEGAASFTVESVAKGPTQAGLTGEWFFQTIAAPGQSSLLTATDASTLEYLARSLGTQPDFPPFLSGFATTTFAPAGDPRANQPSPENTLLASRLLLGSGIRAFDYAPLQDTLTPAGWETPAAARYFRWDAALDLAGNRGPRASGVARNGVFISSWNAMLAASHPRADFGIVDLRTCATAADEATASRNAQAVEQLFHAATLAGFTPELLNPSAQSEERLLRDPVILLPVSQEGASRPEMPDKAREELAEYVRRGGILLDLPASTVEALPAFLEKAGIVPGLRRIGTGQPGANLIATQLVSNEIAASSEQPQECVEGQLCAAALVSVTNISAEEAASESFEMIDPLPAKTRADAPRISLDVTVPAHESLLLPIHAPLCSAASPGEHCTDEVITAGAELLGAEREGKTLDLTFYAPARAVVRLHLESEPSKVELDQDIRLDEQWKQETGELEVSLLRGAAPDYRRILRIHLRYAPHVVEKPDHPKNGTGGSEYAIFDSIRFPLGGDATIETSPPLIVTNPATGGSTVISSSNHADNLRVADFDLEGAFHGTVSARMFGIEQVFSRLHFQPTHNSASVETPETPASDGLLHGSLAIHSGREHVNAPILFLPASDTANIHYQFDFERDGAPEWVLESPRMRMIVSPAEGGRAVALVDKSTNEDLITLGGALHDFMFPAGASSAEAPGAGDFSFNREYHAAWIPEKQETNLKLTFGEFENSDTGIHVEKTLRLTAPETVEASYRVSFAPFPFSPPQSDTETMRSFISMLSVPVNGAEDENTQFCWETSDASTVPIDRSSVKTPPDPSPSHCENFIPSGPLISIPEGMARIKILSPNRPALVVEWTSGQMIVVPRSMSADLRLKVSVPRSAEAPAEFTLRYTIESGP